MKLVNAGFKSKEEARAAIDAGEEVYLYDGRKIQIAPDWVLWGRSPYHCDSLTGIGVVVMTGTDWDQFGSFQKPTNSRDALIEEIKQLKDGEGILCKTWDGALGRVSIKIIKSLSDNNLFIDLDEAAWSNAEKIEINNGIVKLK